MFLERFWLLWIGRIILQMEVSSEVVSMVEQPKYLLAPPVSDDLQISRRDGRDVDFSHDQTKTGSGGFQIGPMEFRVSSPQIDIVHRPQFRRRVRLPRPPLEPPREPYDVQRFKKLKKVIDPDTGYIVLT
ncbi:unnamed protein product [Cyprideis torosa]|uniref:Uncharacterized protein n=1 Tax=Cyprideis torosa TaxID=163714 RepID=A0A7R8WQS0_9CRUS|nr:unnamed protein product [Cyprideis torosa]CAG0908148.1 unnamed protein product [Cyprideis torosa]